MPIADVVLSFHVPSFPLPELSQLSFVPPVQVFAEASSIFQYPTKPSVKRSGFFAPKTTDVPFVLPAKFASVFTCVADLANGYILTSSIEPDHGFEVPSASIPMYNPELDPEREPVVDKEASWAI